MTVREGRFGSEVIVTEPRAQASGVPSETVVLIHPLGVDQRIWDPIVDRLEHYRVVRYDLPGHGSSSPPPETPDADALAEQFDRVFELVHVDSVHVVGMSMGGTVAQYVASTRSERVRSVCIADSVAVYPPFMQQTWRERATTARERGVAALVEDLLEIWFTPEAVAAQHPAVQYCRDTWRATSAEGYAMSCETLAILDVSEAAAGITVPALVVCGVDDLPLMREGARTTADRIGGARLEWLSPGRHAAIRESEDDFVRHLTALFDRARRAHS